MKRKHLIQSLVKHWPVDQLPKVYLVADVVAELEVVEEEEDVVVVAAVVVAVVVVIDVEILGMVVEGDHHYCHYLPQLDPVT